MGGNDHREEVSREKEPSVGPEKRPDLKGGQRKRHLCRKGRRDWRGMGKRCAAHYQKGKWERLLRGGRSSQIKKLQMSPPMSLLRGVVQIPFQTTFDELGKGNFNEVADAEVRLKWVLKKRKWEKGVMNVDWAQEIWLWMKDGSFIERSTEFKKALFCFVLIEGW